MRGTGWARGRSATPPDPAISKWSIFCWSAARRSTHATLRRSTALYFAAERGDVAIVQRLIDRGANVNLAGRSGASPVAAAAYGGNDMVVKMLLARGADGRKPDDTGKPPIVYAAAGGRLDIVKQLLALEIDINARYANDLTLLMWASGPDEFVAEAQALEIVANLLEAAREDRRSRCTRAYRTDDRGGRRSSPAIVKALLAHGADPALTDKDGKTRRRSHGVVGAARGADTALMGAQSPARYSASAARSSGEVASIRSDMPGLLPRARVRKSAMVLAR